MYKVRAETVFSTSHYLNGYEGKCANLHGHNWKVVVEIEGKKLDKLGMLVDFKELKFAINEIAEQLDHGVINNHPYFKNNNINPTAENIAYFFYKKLKNRFHPNKVAKIEVYETEKYVATYLPD